MLPKPASETGKYFLLDPALLHAISSLGGSIDHLLAYFVLARFTDGKTEPKGTRTRAGVNAVCQYTGMGRKSAQNALQWLAATIQASGEPFIRPTDKGYELLGVTETIALPNLLLAPRSDLQAGPALGLLNRLFESAKADTFDSQVITADTLRTQAVLLLVSAYQNLDLARYGGVHPSMLRLGTASVERGSESLGLADTVVIRFAAARKHDCDAVQEYVEAKALELLRVCNAFRAYVGITWPDGEVAYPLYVFGRAPDWMAARYREFLEEAETENFWRKGGKWSQDRLEFRAELAPDQGAELFATPVLLPLTGEVASQTASFFRRTSSPAALSFEKLDNNFNVQGPITNGQGSRFNLQ